VDDERELEIIRHEMEETRSSLAEKLDKLETKVVTPVTDATTAVSHTVEDVKSVVDSVTDSVQDAVQSVKDTFNFSEQIRQHPWLTLGGAVAVGFLGGCLLRPSRRREEPQALDYRPEPSTLSASEPKPEPEPESGGFAPLHALKELAIGTLMGVLREVVVEALPENLKDNVKSVVDDFTTRLGGKPVEASAQSTPGQEQTPSTTDTSSDGGQPNGKRGLSDQGSTPSKEQERVGQGDRQRAGHRGK